MSHWKWYHVGIFGALVFASIFSADAWCCTCFCRTGSARCSCFYGRWISLIMMWNSREREGEVPILFDYYYRCFEWKEGSFV